MQVPLQITFHGLTHSGPVEQYVRDRAAKLDTFAARLTSCRVALELPTATRSTGSISVSAST